MKKNITGAKNVKPNPKRVLKPKQHSTVGMDLGDKTSRFCMLEESGDILREDIVPTTKPGLTRLFAALPHCRVAIEVGTHSRWVSLLLKSFGHEVIVANSRQLQLISQSSSKDDRLDARTLARLARMDPGLLHPIHHRSESAQAHLTVIRVRASLVEARTKLLNSAHGLVKPTGDRLPRCDADQMDVARLQALPQALRETLRPLLEAVKNLTKQIHALDRKIERIAREEYPETKVLRQIGGVGLLISLTFVLTLEDRHRFAKSRDVGCYVGLRPKRSSSGQSDPQLGITKEGDRYLRQLLVQGSHLILGRRGPDTDLKRWGLKLCVRGGKNAKKRAVVAVARKLAVLLHRLWVTGEVYEPLRNNPAKPPRKVAA